MEVTDIWYLRDLGVRQNRKVTEAQIHLYLTAKRYYENDVVETNKYFKTKEKCGELMKIARQLDLNGNIPEKERVKPLTEIEELEDELERKNEELNDYKQLFKTLDFSKIDDGDILEKELENRFIERLFIYNNKIIIVDEGNMIKIRYKTDLFKELMEEFAKIYDWLDSRAAYLKFVGDNNEEYTIHRSEIEMVIHFFDKLNKVKKDN